MYQVSKKESKKESVQYQEMKYDTMDLDQEYMEVTFPRSQRAKVQEAPQYGNVGRKRAPYENVQLESTQYENVELKPLKNPRKT